MFELADITIKQSTDYLVEELVKDKGISKAFARKLLANVLLYNLVTCEIDNMANYLMEKLKNMEEIEK